MILIHQMNLGHMNTERPIAIKLCLLIGLCMINFSSLTSPRAQSVPQPMPSSPTPPPSQNQKQDEASLPIYVSTRFTLVIPKEATTDALAMGLGFGLADSNGNFFGLRAVWIPDPPQDFLSDQSNRIQSAWGPLLEWHNLFSVNGRLSFFSNVAGGFVYGVPQEDQANQMDKSSLMSSNTPREKNLILPIIELGFGLRLSSKKVGDYRLFFAPELGYVFTGKSPYASVSIGVY